MLRNILTLPVPKLAAQHARACSTMRCARSDAARATSMRGSCTRAGVACCEELRREIGLSGSETSWSAAMLRDYGNLSSPFVLFVLQAALRGGAKGGWWWMTSFGAGFSCHGALLRVA
jgi:alkylresorcinol/alkylpyrone synthase